MPRPIPAKVYDAIKAQAEIYGGVGSGTMYDTNTGCPVCGIGLAHAGGAIDLTDLQAEIDRYLTGGLTMTEAVTEVLYQVSGDRAVGFRYSESDGAVSAAGGDDEGIRVPFEAWVEKMDIERGAE